MQEQISHFRRFQGYDYSRGAVLFCTFHLMPRRPLLGHVENGLMMHSAAGAIVRDCIEHEAHRTPDVQLKRSIVMPDHVHLRLYLRPGQPDPLQSLGRFIYNVKCWSQRNIRKTGLPLDWQKNYHDRLCCSREIIDLVDKYIDNNPLKYELMHGNPPPLKVREPLDAPRLPADEWWTGVGNADLLAPGARLAAIRLSRTIPPEAFPLVTARLRKAAEKGYTLCGTFISPCEQTVFADLSARGFPLVRVVQDPLAMVYRPKADEPILFAEARYLLLSRVATGLGRGAAWHGINDALAGIAAEGGTSVYVHHVRGERELRWEFGECGRAGAARSGRPMP